MTGLHVTVPIACFRKGAAREYLETEPLPPPATCYGFLLSFVGEMDRRRHIGCRVTAGLLAPTKQSVVLRTAWRVKSSNYWVDPKGHHHVVGDNQKARKAFTAWCESQGFPKPDFWPGQGAGTNVRPDYQQLLTGASPDHPFIELAVWLDSTEEATAGAKLEERVAVALDPARRHEIRRFGGLSLGESTHLVDSVSAFKPSAHSTGCRLFLAAEQGRLTLPVWVDHVGSAGTRYAVGDLVQRDDLNPPTTDQLPVIRPG
jgi:CRISPR-associated protein Cas5t